MEGGCKPMKARFWNALIVLATLAMLSLAGGAAGKWDAFVRMP